MSNSNTYNEPQIIDNDSLKDFTEALADYAHNIENDIAHLKQFPEDKAVIANLFRALHNIKGDAALCRVDLGVAIIHPIETILDRVRSGKLQFTELLGETILLAIDRLELAMNALSSGKSVSSLKLDILAQELDGLSQARQVQLEILTHQLIQTITGFQPSSTPVSNNARKHAVPPRSEITATHLVFFRSLAQQYESRSPHFEGRTARLLHLALVTNKLAGEPVEPVQLEAAIYMHDVGMMFLPESIWLKPDRLNEMDKIALHSHPGYGAGLLERMPEWHDAAEMVLQHHETPDGTGYPKGLKQDQICSGAKILAIIDAFEAVMLKHSHRGHSRSILRAISEINACNNQFAQEWIEPFNQVIRHMIEK